MNLRDHLQAIYDERRALTPALVVDAARDEGHPLHPRFEWDDTTAAEKYRLTQAGELIRAARVTYISSGKPSQVRAFVPVRDKDYGPAEFVPVDEAMSDPMTSRIVLRDFQRALAQLKAQYGHLTEYAAMLRAAADEGTAA